MTEIPPNTGIGAMYGRRDFEKGPPTYTSQEFIQKIYEATGLGQLSENVRVLDSMSGPGLVGTKLQELAQQHPQSPHHRYYYLDLATNQLAKISGAEGKIAGDARQMPFKEGSFHVGVIRYGAKDIPSDQQPILFQQMYEITAKGGVWVVADMYSPNGKVYKWLNNQHSTKQQMSGRNIEKEGQCHIPLEEGWLNLLTSGGFRAEVVEHHMSFVTTTDWLKNNQVTAEQLQELNDMILNAPDDAKRAFNIRQEEGLVKIDYPITIIRAYKPLQKKRYE